MLLPSIVVGTIVEHSAIILSVVVGTIVEHGKGLLLFGHAFNSGRQRKGNNNGLKG